MATPHKPFGQWVEEIVAKEGMAAFILTFVLVFTAGVLLMVRSPNNKAPQKETKGGATTPTTKQDEGMKASGKRWPFVYQTRIPGQTTEEQSSKNRALCVLLIDPQNDFCDPKGSLFVPGADQDCQRFAEKFKKMAFKVNDVFVTLDTHQKLHIAHGLFWVNTKTNEHPKPFTRITAEDVLKTKTWKASNPKHQPWAEHYVQELQRGGRFQLTIWPDHCLVGTTGHAVYPALAEALQEWETSKNTVVNYVLKGNNEFTEHYSAIKADVLVKDDPNTFLNTDLIETLKSYDRIVVAGEAKSHCVNFTVRDLVEHMPEKTRSKVWVCKDACSSVPGFEAEGTAFESDMKKLGVKFVKTSEAFL